ncbi:MAG: sulfatase [Candidatus Omnitrophota bacterium]
MFTFLSRGLLYPQEKAFEKYNVMLVFIDTLRADRLGCYGYYGGTSPNIDKLAGESAVFEKNFTPATYTLPSFMSIITSLYPGSHGVLEVFKDKLSPRVETLAEILKVYGYKTAWFGPLDDPQLDPDAGFGRGFDDVEDSGNDHILDEAREKLCEWLDKNRNRKFFLNFHTYKVHAPYLPQPKYKAKFTKIKMIEGIIEDKNKFKYDFFHNVLKKRKLAANLMGRELFDKFVAAGMPGKDDASIENFFISRGEEGRMSSIRETVYWMGVNFNDKEASAYIQALYAADILEYDQEVIGPVIKKLKELGIYNKTLIIICSDHGEEFYEHGGFGHGTTFYDEVTRVPLIVRVPWVKGGKRGKEFTQTVDIMPTILDLLEIPVPHQAQGKSLAGFIDGNKPLPPREYVFGRMPVLSSIRSENWLFVLYDGDIPNQKYLYDLVSDPGEEKDVYYKDKKTALGLESRMKEWERSLPSYRDREYSFPPGIDRKMREKIRKTGYW